MSTQVTLRKGTAAQNNAFTGADGEVTVDTDAHALRVHDGVTPGGFATVVASGGSIVGNLTISGNITGGNLNTGGQVVATANVTGGNIITAGQVVATANVTGGNIITAGTVTASGNINANYFVGNGAALTGLPEGFSNANVATFMADFGSNVIDSTGNITTTANISGSYLLGNGSQLTGITGFDPAKGIIYSYVFGG